jgi:transcriptional/translational regulatory protein YebC/TACO1
VQEVPGEDGEPTQYQVSPIPLTDRAGLTDSKVFVAPEDRGKLVSRLSSEEIARTYRVVTSELAHIPADALPISGEEAALSDNQLEHVARTVEHLEAVQEVVKVWTNLADE